MITERPTAQAERPPQPGECLITIGVDEHNPRMFTAVAVGCTDHKHAAGDGICNIPEAELPKIVDMLARNWRGYYREHAKDQSRVVVVRVKRAGLVATL